eukprot:m.1462403 g.1462403  ORF g.1462403 m.1462403 type:complete len:103 (-) comp25134_c0_seq7:2764-3072(-)
MSFVNASTQRCVHTGKKRWILLPPYVHYGPTGIPMKEWLQDWYPTFKNQAYECVQNAGELLYVPTNYMHSVLNLQASIGVVMEVGHDPMLLESILSAYNAAS